MNEAVPRSMNSIDSILEDKGADDDASGFTKTFPDIQVCPKCLAALLCGSAVQKNGLAFRQESDEVGMTLVDWQRGIVHCVLIQHPENPENRSYN